MDWTPAGENALRLVLSEHPSPSTTQGLVALQQEIRELLGNAWIDSAIGYTTLTVFIDFTHYPRERVQRLLASLDIAKITARYAGDFFSSNDAHVIALPTLYSPDVAPDLLSLAEHKGLSLEELIAIHSGQVYFAYANGFAPGFSYLGEVDERLAVPRPGHSTARSTCRQCRDRLIVKPRSTRRSRLVAGTSSGVAQHYYSM